MKIDALLSDPALVPQRDDPDASFRYPRPANPTLVILRAGSDFACFALLPPDARGEVWSRYEVEG